MKQEFKNYANPLMRISIALVFVYFGFKQISSPESWISYIPEFLSGAILNANNLVIINGIFELTLAGFLILGIYVRVSSLILSLHLFFITLSIGFNPTGIRDFGLAVATLTIFLNGPDKYCIDEKFKRKN